MNFVKKGILLLLMLQKIQTRSQKLLSSINFMAKTLFVDYIPSTEGTTNRKLLLGIKDMPFPLRHFIIKLE